METPETRRCPRCGEEKPAGDFLCWEDSEGDVDVCLACHCALESDSLDELAERIDEHLGRKPGKE